MSYFYFFFNDTATTEIYTLSLHDALPIYSRAPRPADRAPELARQLAGPRDAAVHRVRGDALRLVLHGLLLRTRRQRLRMAAGRLRASALRGRGEHRDPDHLELHGALGPAVDPPRQPRGHASRTRSHVPDAPHVPAHAGDRVRPSRLRAARQRLHDDLLLPHRTARRARLRRLDDPPL